MMGYNHAISGAAAWVAVTSAAPDFPALGLMPLEPWEVATGAVVCAGAALLPDADHHNATIAHSVPVVGSVAAGAVGAATGGHRHGLHSIIAIIGMYFATGWIGDLMWAPEWWNRDIPIGAAIFTAALLTFAVKVLKWGKTWLRSWVIGFAAAATLTLFLPDELGWFQLCVTVGFTAHIVGDFLTIEGINWFWPLKIKSPKAVAATPVLNLIWKENGYFAIPVLGKTGSLVEYAFGAALGLYAMAGVAVNVLGLAL